MKIYISSNLERFNDYKTENAIIRRLDASVMHLNDKELYIMIVMEENI